MAKHIGRRHNVGLAPEATPGTFVAPTFFLQQMEFEFDDVVEQIIHDGAFGRIEDSNAIDVVEKKARGSITGRVTDKAMGLPILGVTGTEAAPALVETGVYDHVFTVNNVNVPKTFSLSLSEPNATGASSLRYTHAAIETLEIMMEMRNYLKYKLGLLANTNVAGSVTVAHTSENYFTPVHGIFKVATAQSGLGAAGAVNIRRVNLTINRNLEEDYNIGSLAATARLNKQLMIEGTVELVYDDRTYIDTIMLGDAKRAIRIQAVNSGVTIGATSNPTITIDLHAAKLREVALNRANDGIVLQTLAFKAYYDMTDAAMLTMTLRNTQSAAY